MKPIAQRIQDTRAAIVAELAKLGLPAELARTSSEGLGAAGCVLVEEGYGGTWSRNGTGLVEARVYGVYDDAHAFRARTFKETEKKPIDAAKVAAAVAERQRLLALANAEHERKLNGRHAFRMATCDRAGEGFTATSHHDRVEVSFTITDIDRVGPILDGLEALLKGRAA